MAAVSASVLLMSGGIESATILYHWRQSAHLFPLFINYGQRGAKMEQQACVNLCRHLDIELSQLDMKNVISKPDIYMQVGESFRAWQDPSRLHVPIPHRNLPLLALGTSYASQVGAGTITLALNKDDLGTYSSSSQLFLDGFRSTAAALHPPLDILVPLRDLSKSEVVHMAQRLGVPLSSTYSCMVGRSKHCGRCSQCKLRREAFASARRSEPGDFYES